MVLVATCYRVSRTFPSDERFGLTSQLRRAAVSVPANIAEGHARKQAEFAYFLSVSLGSLAELQCHLDIAVRLGYIAAAVAEPVLLHAVRVTRLTASLHRTVLRARKDARERK